MRKGPDKDNVQHPLQAKVVAQGKETGSSAKRNVNGQEEQVSLPAVSGGGWPVPKMPEPVRAPMWYRHWGLNEQHFCPIISGWHQALGAADMTDLDFCLPIAIAVLIAYLLWSFNRRLNAEIAKTEARHKDWGHKGFEAATISPRIELLRRDYVSAVRSRRAAGCSHIERIARARCAVRELSFFRRICGVAAAQQSNEKLTLGETSA